ncbi:MAG: hypothetical protein RKO24_13820, partial [Candidatus Competibacter sp.]|nr:hypothetical protein [Candidatus Competibacter sp.]
MKIHLLLTVILLPALALTGCSSPPPTTTSAANATEQPALSSTPPPPAATPAPKGVEPKAWDALSHMAAYLRSL